MGLPSDNGLTFRTTDLARWGIGKGAPLTKDEVDTNFWLVLQYVAQAMADVANPHQIASITVANNQMTIQLDDETSFGPYDLPEAAFRWTGAFVGGFSYKRFDILTASDGAYLVLRDHTSATTFDPNASDMTGALYALMFAYQNIFDVGFFFPGIVGQAVPAGQPMFGFQFRRDAYLPANLPNSGASFITNPSALWSVDIEKNGVLIGTYTFDPNSSSAPEGFFDFATDVQFNAGDVLTVFPPASLDATAAGFALTFAAKKGTF